MRPYHQDLAMLSAGSPIHVRKLRPDGSQHYAWDGSVVRCDEEGIVVQAAFNVDVVELGFTTFRRGDMFVEFYYWSRPYNVFQISAADGTLKGWYANLGLPAELDADRNELIYVDLALDVWANPDGTFAVLDEDELDELLARHPEFSQHAQEGRSILLGLAETGTLPRWPE